MKGGAKTHVAVKLLSLSTMIYSQIKIYLLSFLHRKSMKRIPAIKQQIKTAKNSTSLIKEMYN